MIFMLGWLLKFFPWSHSLISPTPYILPPEYEEDEEIDYTLDEEDSANMILDDLGLPNYDNIEKQLNQPEMT